VFRPPLVVFEIGALNADKPPLPREEIVRRLSQFDVESNPLLAQYGITNFAVSITSEPLFLEKSYIFKGCHFVVGADTMVRLVNSKYYADPVVTTTAANAAREGALVTRSDGSAAKPGEQPTQVMTTSSTTSTTSSDGHANTTNSDSHESTTDVHGQISTTDTHDHASSTSMDGHISTTSREGNMHTTSSDGHETTTDSGGSASSTTNSDGQVSSTSRDGHMKTTSSDGHVSITSGDGHLTTTRGDSHVSTTSSDGHVSTTSIDGHESTTTTVSTFTNTTVTTRNTTTITISNDEVHTHAPGVVATSPKWASHEEQRVLQERVQQRNVTNMVAALTRIAENKCTFIVGGRVKTLPAVSGVAGTVFETCDMIMRESYASITGASAASGASPSTPSIANASVTVAEVLPRQVSDMFRSLPEEAFRLDLSSTEIRNRLAAATAAPK
jgi:hypothetical protein